jgi:hypothetical protein
MAREKGKPHKDALEKDDGLKDLAPKQDEIVGGRFATKHPAKVTVPDLKF